MRRDPPAGGDPSPFDIRHVPSLSSCSAPGHDDHQDRIEPRSLRSRAARSRTNTGVPRMRNRKRHTAQPMLEPMEPRVVPSVTGIHAHHEQVVAAHVGQMHDSVKEATASPRENNKALKQLQQQEYLVHVRSLERTPSALPTAAEQAASASLQLIQIGIRSCCKPRFARRPSATILTGSSRTI